MGKCRPHFPRWAATGRYVAHFNHLSNQSVRGTPALATGSGGFRLILGEVPRIMLRSAATADQAAFTARFRRPFAIISKVARTVLPADMTGPSGLFAILGEVSRIPGMASFCHRFPSFCSN